MPTPTPTTPLNRLYILVLGAFALGLDAYVMAGLLPEVAADLHTSESAAGQMVTLFTLCYALAAPVFATALAGRPEPRRGVAGRGAAGAPERLTGRRRWG
jgi:predicted MFS family arabinose efflux permease